MWCSNSLAKQDGTQWGKVLLAIHEGYADHLWSGYNLFKHTSWTGERWYLDANFILELSLDPDYLWTGEELSLSRTWVVSFPLIYPHQSQLSSINIVASPTLNQSRSRQHLNLTTLCPEQEARKPLILHWLNPLPLPVQIFRVTLPTRYQWDQMTCRPSGNQCHHYKR